MKGYDTHLFLEQIVGVGVVNYPFPNGGHKGQTTGKWSILRMSKRTIMKRENDHSKHSKRWDEMASLHPASQGRKYEEVQEALP